MERSLAEKFEDYKNRIYSASMALKRYLKGTMAKAGTVYVPKEPKRSGKFTKKHYNFKKAKARRAIQKKSRKRNRKP